MPRAAACVLPVLLALAAAAAQEPAPAPPRPNIVVFLVDDLGWQDASVAFHTERTALNERFHTPHLAALAEQGVRFRSAYACAVCSPTRTSLMTGQNAARHGVTNWTLHADRDQSGTTERLRAPDGWRREGLQPGPDILPERLRAAGYATIHAGKAHWGARGTAGSDPRALGFDVAIAGHAAGAPATYDGRVGFRTERGGEVWAVPGLEHYHGLPVHLTDALTVEALRAVDAALDAGRPFYLYLAHYGVHTPIEPHDPYTARYRAAGLDETEARYAAMVEGVDASLGAVLAHLRRRGVAERTIVLYGSDNGGLSAVARGRSPAGGVDTHNAPLRAGKGSAYEGGVRVPQVVAWAAPADTPLQRTIPVERGAVRATPTIVEDWYPTICRWTGAGPAASAADGVDLTPLLAREAPDLRAGRPLLFHYPHVWGPRTATGHYEPYSALRLGRHKVIWFYDRATWELYDLEADLGEAVDLAVREPELLARLAARLVAELDARGARYPADRRTGAPVRPRLP